MSGFPYHVHVYKVVELKEIDLQAADKKEAREKALELTEVCPFKQSKLDCKHIAIAFNGAGGHE